MGREQLRRYAVYIVGLALLFAMDRPPVFAFLLANVTDETRFARMVSDLSLAVFGLGLAVASFRFPQLLKAKRPLAIAGGALASIAALITALHTYGGLFASPVLAVGGAAFSAGRLLLIASWFLASRALPSRRLLPAVLLAFALSMGLIAIDFLPVIWHITVVVSLPLICAGFAALTEDDDLTLGLLEPYERPRFEPAVLVDALAIGLLLVEMLGATLIRSLWAHQGIGYSASQTAVATYLFSLCIALLCAAACARAGYAEKGAFSVSIITLPILIAASFGFLFFDDNSLAVSIVTSVSSVAAAALMAMTSIAFRGERLPYLGGAGAYAAALGITTWIAYSILPALLRFTGTAPSQLSAPIVFVAVCAIMLALACALGTMLLENARRFEEWQQQTTAKTVVIKASRARGVKVRREATTNEGRGEDDAVDLDAALAVPEGEPSCGLHEKLRRAFDLTDREADIAELLALGYTAKRVADELTLSVSTVQSYTKAIYRKMGVHKKDELIERVAVLR